MKEEKRGALLLLFCNYVRLLQLCSLWAVMGRRCGCNAGDGGGAEAPPAGIIWECRCRYRALC